jgi:hypothetical protein
LSVVNEVFVQATSNSTKATKIIGSLIFMFFS